MPFVKFQTSPKSGGNSGSCGKALGYLEKEDKDRGEEHELKGFFTAEKSSLSHDQAKNEVEHQFYKKSLRKEEAKFYSVTMSFSKDELKGKDNRELMDFAKKNFAEMYSNSINGREVDSKSIAWVAKLEETRSYKGTDKAVKEGRAKSGEKKGGDQRHIHFIVARKTLDNKKVSPLSNHFRKGKSTGAVKSGFDQDKFKIDCEQRFDERFKHHRAKEDKVTEKLSPYRQDILDKTKIDKVKQEVNQTKLNTISEKVKEFKNALGESTRKAFEMLQGMGKKLKEKLTQKHSSMAKEEKRKEVKSFINKEKEDEKKDVLGSKFVNREKEKEIHDRPSERSHEMAIDKEHDQTREQEEQSRDQDKDKNKGNDQELSR